MGHAKTRCVESPLRAPCRGGAVGDALEAGLALCGDTGAVSAALERGVGLTAPTAPKGPALRAAAPTSAAPAPPPAPPPTPPPPAAPRPVGQLVLAGCGTKCTPVG